MAPAKAEDTMKSPFLFPREIPHMTSTIMLSAANHILACFANKYKQKRYLGKCVHVYLHICKTMDCDI